MGLIIIAALLGLIPAMIAQSKGRSFGVWWVYGFLLFIIAIIHSLIIKNESLHVAKGHEIEGGECPYCAELIKYHATKCKHCGSEVPAIEPPKPKYSGTQIAWKRVGLLLAIIIVIAFVASQNGKF